MRRLFVIALALVPIAVAATAVEITRAEDCAPAVAADAAAAREQAAIWYRLGGGTAARLCEAQALEAMGADATAAQLLTGVAQNTNRAMRPDLRAVIFEDAGRLWLRSGRADLARETLSSADRLTPPAPDRLILRARAEAAEQDWPAADTTLRQVLAGQPGNALALALHAATLRHSGDRVAALAEAERARAADPDLPEAIFESAAALAETGQREAANVLWLRLIEADPDGDLAAVARRNLQSTNAGRTERAATGPRPRPAAPPPG